MQFTFNTGRKYTAEGQVITVKVTDGKVLFKDHSRYIYGEIAWTGNRELTQSAVEMLVMSNYDLGNYSHNSEAGQLERV
jgi:hypothetical protein